LAAFVACVPAIGHLQSLVDGGFQASPLQPLRRIGGRSREGGQAEGHTRMVGGQRIEAMHFLLADARALCAHSATHLSGYSADAADAAF